MMVMAIILVSLVSFFAFSVYIHVGCGLGMIGTRLNAADLVHAGIATHFIQT